MEARTRPVAPVANAPAASEARGLTADDATSASALSKLQMPRSTTDYTDGSLSIYEKCGINVVEIGNPEPLLGLTTGALPFAQPAHSIRSTFPGNTTFKALCNSYLRKLLRGQAPDALYWVANATLPNGERVLARLRLTVVVEDLCIEALQEVTRTPATIELAFGAPIRPKS